MQHRAAAEGDAQYEQRFHDRAQPPGCQPVCGSHGQALVQHVPREHRLAGIRQPSPGASEQHLSPSQQGHQRRPPVQRMGCPRDQPPGLRGQAGGNTGWQHAPGHAQAHVYRGTAEREPRQAPAQADQRVPERVLAGHQQADDEHRQVLGMVGPVVREGVGAGIARIQPYQSRHHPQRWQGPQQPAASGAQPVRPARCPGMAQQRPAAHCQQRVGPQVRQVPQVVPGEAVGCTREARFRPRPQLQVAGKEGKETGFDRAQHACLAIGLDRYDEGDARRQRDQKAPAAVANPLQRRASRQDQAQRDSRQQEQQGHPPAVDQHHRPFHPAEQVLALHMEAPAVHVDHAHVVEDQRREGGDAQGVDVVAAFHCGSGTGRNCSFPAPRPHAQPASA